MGAISATDIISIIQSEIENFDFDTESRETGEVIYVGDGIATIYGIDHAMYGEIVVFDNGVKGIPFTPLSNTTISPYMAWSMPYIVAIPSPT